MDTIDDAQTLPESRTQRPWLKPTAALARFAPRVSDDRGPGAREQAVRYGFSIGDFGLLISQNAGCETIPSPTVARMPTTPAWLLGVANLRGSLVPIFDLRALFGLPATKSAVNRFGLIFDRGEYAVGILVSDRPLALEKLEPLRQPPPLPAAARDFVSAAYRHGQSVWLEFDHRRFFESVAQRMAVSSAGESTT